MRITLLFILLLAIALPCLAKERAPLATVNGRPLTEQQMGTVINRGQLDSASIREAIGELVARDSITKLAQLAGVTNDPDFSRQLASIYEQYLISKQSQSYEPTEAELKETYETATWLQRPAHKAVAVIMMPSKEDVASMIGILDSIPRTCTTRESLMAYVASQPNSRVEFREIFPLAEEARDSMMIDPISRHASKAKIGERVGPNRFGSFWYAFKVLAEIPAGKASLESVTFQIRQFTQQQHFKREIEQIRNKIKTEAKIVADIPAIQQAFQRIIVPPTPVERNAPPPPPSHAIPPMPPLPPHVPVAR